MTEQGMTFMAAWNCGGPLMWVLAGISVLALAVALYLIFSQRSAAIAPTDLVSDVMDRLRARDLAEARRLADRRSSAFSVLAIAALDALAGASKGGASHVSQAIETAGSHVAERLQGAVDWLADLAAIAPLVGLLGTVLGMYQAFGGIANDLAANGGAGAGCLSGHRHHGVRPHRGHPRACRACVLPPAHGAPRGAA